MREYAQLKPRFWTQGTGKALRGDRDARLVALYLMSCPSSNMIGLYYLPVKVMAYELGMPEHEAWGALARVCETGFAEYDDGTEYVWVVNMAREQVGEAPKFKDKRVRGVRNELRKHSKSVFYRAFVSYYGPMFAVDAEGVATPSGTPSEGVATQEDTPPIKDQDQDQDQEQEQESARGAGLAPAPDQTPPAESPKPTLAGQLAPVWAALGDLGYPTDEMSIRQSDLAHWRRIAGALDALGGRRDVSGGSTTVQALAAASCASHVARHKKLIPAYLAQDFVQNLPPDQPAAAAKKVWGVR